jgi:tetratricopeptide (TPR) repeat protein
MSHAISRRWAAALLALTAGAATAQPAAPAAWRDLSGARHTAVSAAGRPTVLLFGSTRCPCADGYTARINRLAGEYGGRARFFLVFSAPGVPRAEVEAYRAARGLRMPVVHDADGRLARRYNAQSTPTAVVLGADGRTRYLGGIDDNPEPVAVRREYLREALDAVLSGRPMGLTRTVAVGCSLAGGGAAAEPKPVRLVDGIGRAEFPVSTRVTRAQRFFNQGLARWFGFNFPEAERSFREAARLDPNLAMAHWGITLSMGMTYNFDFDPARLPEAVAAIRKAESLAAGATEKERALISALALRHPADAKPEDQKLEDYHAAMAKVRAAYPEDVHIGTLYAASAMDLRPWALWKKNGEPAPGTPEIVRVLEDVLRRDPDHIGAHHLYIHATEASPEPQKAVDSARRLADLAPQSGHLVHMPAHTWVRIGEYLNSAISNNRAASVDRAYFAAQGGSTPYAGYYVHNLDFLIAAYAMDGRAAESLETAAEMAKVVARLVPAEAPLWCGSASSVMSVYTRFHRWDDILRAAAPDEKNPFAMTWHHYGRVLAFTAKGDLVRAAAEQELLEKASRAADEAVPPIPTPGFQEGFKRAYRLARVVGAGKLALARGDHERALALFREGVEIEDGMPYIEPATWRYPVREALGGALLKLGRPAEAETVFRADLLANPKSGRALFGLLTALERQGKQAEAEPVRAQFQTAWKRADFKLDADAL